MGDVIENMVTNETSCECPECKEFGGPNPKLMTLRLPVLAAQLLLGVFGLIKEKSFKALGALIGALAFFAFIPRRLICCRCEGYGKNCYSFYLGKITSLYLPKEEGEITPLAMGLEALALTVIANAPAVGLRKNRRLLAIYLVLSFITFTLQFRHACRHCALYATDWKKECPSAKLARRVFAEQ